MPPDRDGQLAARRGHAAELHRLPAPLGRHGGHQLGRTVGPDRDERPHRTQRLVGKPRRITGEQVGAVGAGGQRGELGHRDRPPRPELLPDRTRGTSRTALVGPVEQQRAACEHRRPVGQVLATRSPLQVLEGTGHDRRDTSRGVTRSGVADGEQHTVDECGDRDRRVVDPITRPDVATAPLEPVGEPCDMIGGRGEPERREGAPGHRHVLEALARVCIAEPCVLVGDEEQ